MRKKLLICDLDNTLYDWVAYFVDAFYALADEVVRITNCDREQLLDDFREVHRMHHDAEHPFAVLETKAIATIFPQKSRAEIAQILDPALHAFNSRRKRSLALYAGVRETLDALRENNVTLVAHTESKLYAVVDRLSRLELVEYFNHIYCRERSNSLHPSGDGAWDYLSNFPMDKVIELSHHQRKPNQRVLLEICAREGVSPEDTAYVGDSMSRDVLMAKRAHVYAIWAKYGTNHNETDYQRLVRVSHWTDEDIRREKTLAIEVSSISPDYIAENSFAEVLSALSA
ncbi:HAD-IA family hydrolase [Phyllobacterium sp. LjRoot231]|uniref:HAD family hydrolase n=1 Tax=Phyllobacterium sp. LjRoot231 TaxID=3342289 RepID=UPI003ED08C58